MNFFEGFAHGLKAALTGYWVTASGNSTINTTQKHQDINNRGSSYSFLMTTSSVAQASYVFPNGDTWAHVAFFSPAPSGVSTIFQVFRSGAVNCTVSVDGAGAVEIRRGSGAGTKISTNDPLRRMTYGVWHWFWIQMVCDSAAGTVNVYMDGSSTAIATNDLSVNTANTGTSGWDQVNFPVGTGNGCFYGDIMTFTAAEKAAAFTGLPYPEMFIPAVQPNSTDAGQTFPTGTFADVDEVPWVSPVLDSANANAVGQEILFGTAGLGYTPPSVKAVANTFYAERDGAVLNYQGRLKIGAADVTSASLASIGAATYSERQVFYPVNPDGPAQWAPADLPNIHFGVKTA